MNNDTEAGAITPEQYMQEAKRTLYPDLTTNDRLGLCGLGLPGEIGEVVDFIKKFCYHRSGLSLAVDKIKDELGDVMWYFFILLDTVGLTFEQVMQTHAPEHERGRVILSDLDCKEQLEFCGLELASSLGRIVDLLSRVLYWNAPLDMSDLKKRLGNVLWCTLMFLDTLGVTFEEVMQANAKKLKRRHPHGFNPRYKSDSGASE